MLKTAKSTKLSVMKFEKFALSNPLQSVWPAAVMRRAKQIKKCVTFIDTTLIPPFPLPDFSNIKKNVAIAEMAAKSEKDSDPAKLIGPDLKVTPTPIRKNNNLNLLAFQFGNVFCGAEIQLHQRAFRCSGQ